MGQSELEAALRKDGDDKAREIWATVEAEAERLRTETADNLRRHELAEKARCEAQVLALNATKQAESEQRAQRCRLEAEEKLAKHLRQLADELLTELAATGGDTLFLNLVAELPLYSWQQIKVNLRDRLLAEEHFPQAEIIFDDQISAGVEVQDEEGRILIVNTLEKRLAHLWSELLPELMSELRRKAGDHESVA